MSCSGRRTLRKVTTALWIPLVSTGIGSLTTLIGVVVTHLVTRSRFQYDKEQRRRETLRDTLANLMARGIDYASKVDVLVRRADERLPGLVKDSPEWAKAAAEVLEAIDSTYQYREPMFHAVYAADITVPRTSEVRPTLDRYIEAVFGLGGVVSHYTNAFQGTEDYQPSLGSDTMTEFHSALGVLAEAAHEHLRVLD